MYKVSSCLRKIAFKSAGKSCTLASVRRCFRSVLPVCRHATVWTGYGEHTVQKADGEEGQVSSHSGAAQLDAVLEELWTVPSLSLLWCCENTSYAQPGLTRALRAGTRQAQALRGVSCWRTAAAPPAHSESPRARLGGCLRGSTCFPR